MSKQQEYELEQYIEFREKSKKQNGSSIQPQQAKKVNDTSNIIWLIVLYLFQGIPLGLTFGTLPFLLHKHSSFTQIGIFSFSSLPYSLKILWSPLVDACYWKWFGRRKSWIVPIQIAAGLLFIHTSYSIEWLLEHCEQNIQAITGIFFLFVLFMATQDIAVDGWALTLLDKSNVHLASTCQTIGQTTGYFLSYTIFLALNSSEFSNRYLWFLLNTNSNINHNGSSSNSLQQQQEMGLVTLPGYFRFWGMIFILFSLYLALFKSEEGTCNIKLKQDDQELIQQQNQQDEGEENKEKEERILLTPTKKLKKQKKLLQQQHKKFNNSLQKNIELDIIGEQQQEAKEIENNNNLEDDIIVETDMGPLEIYKRLWSIINLAYIRKLSILFLTSKIIFIANDSALSLRLLEKGVKKEQMAFFSLIQFPCSILFSIYIAKFIKDKPLTLWVKAYLFGILFITTNMLILYFFPIDFINSENSYYLIFVLLGSLLNSTAHTTMSLSQGAFFLKIGEKDIGGTFLTLLNTIANLGGTWPKFFILYLIDHLTMTSCYLSNEVKVELADGVSTDEVKALCMQQGGRFVMERDGYYLVVLFSIFYGLVMHRVLKRFMIPIQQRMK